MLHSIDKVGIPYHTVHMDHLGPFIKSRKGNTYLLVAIDGFTKHVMLTAVKSTKAEPTAKFLKSISEIFGPPARVITDRGTAFTGRAFEKLCKEHHITHIRNATSTPRANGQCERINRMLIPAIASMSHDPENRDWDEYIANIQWAINNSKHGVTGETPFHLLFGYRPRDLGGNPLRDALMTWEHKAVNIDEKRRVALERIRENQNRQQEIYNKKRARANHFQVGDIVLVRRDANIVGESRKLLPKYRGPYIITEVLPYDRYRLEDVPEIQRTQKFYKGIAAVDVLKKVEAEDELEGNDAIEQDHSEESAGEEETSEEAPDGGSEVSKEEGSKKESKEIRRKRKPAYLNEYVMGVSEDGKDLGWPNVGNKYRLGELKKQSW